MTVNFDESDSGVSRFFYQAHGIMSEPVYRVVEYITRCKNPLDPKLFDHYSTKPRELAYRLFAPGALMVGATYLLKTLPLRNVAILSGKVLAGVLVYEVLRTVMHVAACFAQTKNHIHVRGNAPEVKTDTPKVATWNIFGFPCGGNYIYGGCKPFRDREPSIIETIHDADPDVVVLQECIWDSKIPENLIRAFKDKYAHFFIHNGPLHFMLESGLFVMSKCPIQSYTFTPFNTEIRGINRGFATLKFQGATKSYAIIVTHMEPNDPVARRSQLEQIYAAAQAITDVDQVILMGDTNINMKSEEAARFKELFNNPFQDTDTCTNLFRQQRDAAERGLLAESIDVIALLKNSNRNLKEARLFPCYKSSSKKALSDHHMLMATVSPMPLSHL